MADQDSTKQALLDAIEKQAKGIGGLSASKNAAESLENLARAYAYVSDNSPRSAYEDHGVISA